VLNNGDLNKKVIMVGVVIQMVNERINPINAIKAIDLNVLFFL
jgi:hypothetical protein